jgi:hypothetical protein
MLMQRGKLTLVIIAALIMGPVWGQSGPSALALVIDTVLQRGPANQLPTHLSVVLGITKAEQPVPVKQAVMREAATVRTFNVCTGNHADVVLAVYDEQSRAFKAYLTDAAGTLRKAVAYQAGEAPIVRTSSEARSDFVQELTFWRNLQHTTAPTAAPR